MCTDLPDSFQGRSFLGLCGYTMSQSAARRCFSDASMSPGDVDIIELHDCFAPNEVSSSIGSLVNITQLHINIYRWEYGAVLTVRPTVFP